ncbi:hypothetical protein OHT52_08995 [Streptomyces sp. NBC_00247]|uniref:hypothetical protein n=1 Tax=Streptomyces sp. NBC_00247 TaxID=2975689 RepID=UPI002E2B5FC9|nr:hypothetical protein [Streptomyces sp. NBC_00247]
MTLTRGARITGTALSAVLALITAGWIVRDLRVLHGPGPLWDMWSGLPEAFPAGMPTTTGGTLVLLLVQVVTAFVVPRSPVAAAALVATGTTTLLLRLPGVWITTASWMAGRYSDELRVRALIFTLVTLAVSVAMIVTAAVGRRPAVEVGLPAPTRPTTGAAVVAFLALGISGVVVIAWEIRQYSVYPAEVYPAWYFGGHAISAPLYDAPAGWSTVAVALLALFAGAAALAHAVHSRPFAGIAAAFLLFSGGMSIVRGVRLHLFGMFTDAGIEGQLSMMSWVFLALAGVVALLATVRRGRPAAGGGPGEGWGPGAPGYGYPPLGPPGRAPGYGYPYPSSASGSGYPGTPGYGYPPAGYGPGQDSGRDPAQGSGPGPGQGPGPGGGGGFGPPPPSSPPPGR